MSFVEVFFFDGDRIFLWSEEVLGFRGYFLTTIRMQYFSRSGHIRKFFLAVGTWSFFWCFYDDFRGFGASGIKMIRQEMCGPIVKIKVDPH